MSKKRPFVTSTITGKRKGRGITLRKKMTETIGKAIDEQ